MVSTQEIVERSLYMSLLHTTLRMGYTLDPDNYLIDGLPNPDTEQQFQLDKAQINPFIYVFGVGNNQAKGIRECPRIVLDAQNFYPGGVGVEKYNIGEKEEDGTFRVISYPDFTTHDIMVDVHLVAKTQPELRLLHTIMYTALPAMGYIKPYYNDKEEWNNGKLAPSDNIFMEVANYYDHKDLEHGTLEKVYSYRISDGILLTEDIGMELVPIHDISLLLPSLELNVAEENNNTQGL